MERYSLFIHKLITHNYSTNINLLSNVTHLIQFTSALQQQLCAACCVLLSSPYLTDTEKIVRKRQNALAINVMQ